MRYIYNNVNIGEKKRIKTTSIFENTMKNFCITQVLAVYIIARGVK